MHTLPSYSLVIDYRATYVYVSSSIIYGLVAHMAGLQDYTGTARLISGQKNIILDFKHVHTVEPLIVNHPK